jgi:Domain of unknown function (DUF4124)
MRPILLLALAFFCLGAAADTFIYKWKDDKGVTHFSESPPPNVNAEKVGIKVDRTPTAIAQSQAAAQKSVDDKERIRRAAACKAALAQITMLRSQPLAPVASDNGQHTVARDYRSEAKVSEYQMTMRRNCD